MNEQALEAEKAHQCFENLQHTLRQGVYASLESGMWLSQMRENNWYRTILGDPKATWLSFLGMPELTLTYSTADKLMRLYQTFKVKFETADAVLGKISESKLKLISPKLTHENQAKLLQAAASQTYSDLKITLAEMERGVSAADCQHSNVTERILWQCMDCKQRLNKKP